MERNPELKDFFKLVDESINNLEHYQAHQSGWVCPKCGRVYSPSTYMCVNCSPMDISCNNIQWKK